MISIDFSLSIIRRKLGCCSLAVFLNAFAVFVLILENSCVQLTKYVLIIDLGLEVTELNKYAFSILTLIDKYPDNYIDNLDNPSREMYCTLNVSVKSYG